MNTLNARLEKRKQAGNIRQLKIIEDLIDFSSNDYLGLAKSKELFDSISSRWQQHLQVGSGGSRLLTGNSPCVEKLEMQIAKFHGFETGLLFGTGYLANIGLITAVAQSGDIIIYDTEMHASTLDGIRLSKALAYPFRHNDLIHLEKRLIDITLKGNLFICVESVYSTDGSMAPLKEISVLAKRYGAYLIVDEAHAIGLIGNEGRGVVAMLGLEENVFAMVATFGKGPGVYGAIVLGSELLKKSLINFARPVIYTTALPFYNLAAIECSYAIFPKLENERRHVRKLIEMFRIAYPEASTTHIQCVRVKGNQQALALSQRLAEKGFDVRALLSPTIRRGHERLRICLHVFNTEEHLKGLIEAIKIG